MVLGISAPSLDDFTVLLKPLPPTAAAALRARCPACCVVALVRSGGAGGGGGGGGGAGNGAAVTFEPKDMLNLSVSKLLRCVDDLERRYHAYRAFARRQWIPQVTFLKAEPQRAYTARRLPTDSHTSQASGSYPESRRLDCNILSKSANGS